MGIGFKNVMWDSFNKQILVRRIGSTEYEKVPFSFDYWTEDETGQSEIKDCYGIPMKRVVTKDKNTLKILRQNGVKLAESDISEVVKWIHSEYDDKELDSDVKNFNICFFDIEVQTGRKYYLDSNIKIRKVGDASGETRLVSQRKFEESVANRDAFEVWDPDAKAWSKFDGSCYHNSEFPEPLQADYPINLITCYSSFTNETYTWGLEDYTGNDPSVTNYKSFHSELEMMKDWIKWMGKQKFDIISGWNSAMFDVPFIMNRLKKLEEMNELTVDLSVGLSPLLRKAQSKAKIQVKTGIKEGETFDIPGLLSIDYMEVFKKFAGYQNLPSWKLNYVGELELGEGKLEYQGAISEIYRNDWNKYVEYNVQDVLLLKKIENKKKLWDLVISFAHDCLIPLDKVFSMIATVEGYMLKYLHSQKMVMNDKKPKGTDWWLDDKMFIVKDRDGNITYQNCEYEKGIYSFEPFHVKAGYVYADPGRYDHVMSGDITSSYPHQMMMYNISPEVKVIRPTKEQIESGEVIRSEINGVGFRRTDNAILPSIVKKVFAERKHFKKLMKEAHKAGDFVKEAQYDNIQHGKKIIINSVYGVSLNENFHFFDIDCARSITRCARVCIRYLKEYTNKYYTSKQILKDSMNFFPVINLRYDNTDHWFKKTDKIHVLEISSNTEMDIEAQFFDKDKYLLDVLM